MGGRKLKAIIFDCDGVLVDSEGPANSQLAEELQAIGLDYTYEKTRQTFIGLSWKDVQKKLEEVTGDLVSENWIDEIRQRTGERVRKDLKPVEGVKTFIQETDNAGLHRAVASSSGLINIERKLKACGIFEGFEGKMHSGENVLRSKPYPDVYLAAIKTLDLKPNEIIAIEDTPVGASASIAAGLKTYGLHIDPHSDHEGLISVGAIPVPDFKTIADQIFD